MKKLLLMLICVMALVISASVSAFALDIASTATATPTAATVLVNGERTSFDAYNIAGNNYFKLRDLAYALNGSAKQFDVGWDGQLNAIFLSGNKAYTVVGGEMAPKGAGSQTATLSSSQVYLDGDEVLFTAYNIGGNNYFRLRDIGQVFDFGVTWDNASSTIAIDTSIGYAAEDTTTTTPAADADGDGFEEGEEKLSAALTLHNGYLGISYTIPANWWLYEVNYENLSTSADATKDDGALDIFFGDGYNYIEMAYFGNLQYSRLDNHLGIDLSAEKIAGVDTLDEYMPYYIDYMLEPYMGDTYNLLEETTVTINGKEFRQCIFRVNQEGRPYNILTMTCAVKDGYFLTLSGNYWPNNTNAVENIQKYIKDGLKFL